jgi:hypothetical protein
MVSRLTLEAACEEIRVPKVKGEELRGHRGESDKTPFKRYANTSEPGTRDQDRLKGRSSTVRAGSVSRNVEMERVNV